MLKRALVIAGALAAAGGVWILARAATHRPAAPGPVHSKDAPWFAEDAERRGVRFRMSYSGPRPLDIQQTAGTGVAMWDYDGDGWLDLYLVGQQGRSPGGHGMLYHNHGDGTFEDTTAGSGLERPGKWHGCAVGDVDNDGRPDLLLTGYGACALYRNRGAGRFADVTAGSGLAPPSSTAWATSAAFADVNADGRLDLFIGRYVQFGPKEVRFCDFHGVMATCGPKFYSPQRGSLYLNQGRARFKDVTAAWKLSDQQGKTLGMAFADANGDGYPELYLANDEVPGDLYLNEHGHGFRSIGAVSGAGLRADGQVQGGMGVDWGDYDGDGRADLFVTTFENEPDSLYRNLDGTLFEHASAPAGFGNVTVPYVSFGTKFLDYDNDGWLDLITTSGHIQDNVAQVDHTTSYAQPLQLFRNEQGKRFSDVTARAGEGLQHAMVGRGLAVGDINNDGRVDVLVADLEGPARLLVNSAPARNHWLLVHLVGSRSNRMALGASVRVTASGRAWVRQCQTSGSYLSASDGRVHFGLGSATGADIEVRWPSGRVTEQRAVAADHIVTLREKP